MKRFRIWFKGLTRLKKVGVVTLAVLVGLLIIGAVSPDPKRPAARVELGDRSLALAPCIFDADSEPDWDDEDLRQEGCSPIRYEDGQERPAAEGSTAPTNEGVERAAHHSLLGDLYRRSRDQSAKTGQQGDEEPIAKVFVVGTRPKPKPVVTFASRCDSNYSGCVPIASDVDCAGRSGDGPAYQPGVVRVTGIDVYDLDRDGDEFGCD